MAIIWNGSKLMMSPIVSKLLVCVTIKIITQNTIVNWPRFKKKPWHLSHQMGYGLARLINASFLSVLGFTLFSHISTITDNTTTSLFVLIISNTNGDKNW